MTVDFVSLILDTIIIKLTAMDVLTPGSGETFFICFMADEPWLCAVVSSKTIKIIVSETIQFLLVWWLLLLLLYVWCFSSDVVDHVDRYQSQQQSKLSL